MDLARHLPSLVATAAPGAALLDPADWRELGPGSSGAGARRAPAPPARQRRPGAGASSSRGRGTDYLQSRAYQPGDDLRDMHWALLARTGMPHVREYEQEHAAAWHVLVDAHAGMLFGTQRRTKATQAARAALLAAGLQARLAPQTPLSCTVWSARGPLTRDFGSGRAAVPRMAQWLMQQRIVPPPSLAGAQHESLAQLRLWVHRLLLRRAPPAGLLLCSDFAWLDTQAARALEPLAAKARCAALQVMDAVELALPLAPPVAAIDAATGQQGWLVADDAARREFEQAADSRREQLRQALRRLGARVARLRADSDAPSLRAALVELLA